MRSETLSCEMSHLTAVFRRSSHVDQADLKRLQVFDQIVLFLRRETRFEEAVVGALKPVKAERSVPEL